MHGLQGIRVVDFSTGVAGPYATKLLADAGADVVKVESAEGDPLRRWSSTGGLTDANEDGALFQFLNFSKRSVVADLDAPEVRELIAGADLVVESFGPRGGIDVAALAADEPGLVVLSISPYGRSGPFADRPATEFTVQAQCGSMGTRGLQGQEPFQVGGRTPEWLAGTFAAVAALAAVHRARRTGHGEAIDFSIHEVMNLAGTNYSELMCSLLGIAPAPGGPLPQSVETPSIEPTADGFVGFCTNSRQQFSDFLLMIGRTDLQDDEALAQVGGRMARFAEWNEIVHEWTRTRTTAEIVEAASLLRIPVSPVNNGDTVRAHEQLVARGVFRESPGPRPFTSPRPPYRVDDESPAPPRPAPKLGEHTGQIEARERLAASALEATGRRRLPLEGLRILDMTAWWAGPSATHMLACLGADVIHVESTGRPDGMRMIGGMLMGKFPEWWECSAFFLAANTNKRGLAIDLTTERGRDALLRVIDHCDAVVENFTPRVLENFGLDWETLHARSPQTLLVRMPAFGLSGPWRDNTGFAQTMEQMSGLAWLTGHADDQPRIQRGPCDPLAGMHAAFSLLVALEEREAKGQGVHVECTMVEGALNAAAEQVIEFTAYGNLLAREGNRSPTAAPQGLYACQGSEPGAEQWLALSVASDAQWQALVGRLGRPAWATRAELATLAGRRAAHDEIDREISAWVSGKDREALAEELLADGIPAAPAADPRLAAEDPQLAHRGFFEPFEHPVVGQHRAPGQPFRYASVDRWIRSVAPTLGQHNREILRDLGGLTDSEIDALEADNVIGSRPDGL